MKTTRLLRDGFFLRAESFFNVATAIEELALNGYGGKSLHEQSHGESFLALITNRFGGDALYLLDEPEAALSPKGLLSLLALIRQLVDRAGSQFIIATHSPILMAYPDATIYELGATGIEAVAYEDIAHYQITRDFLNHRERYLARLFADE